MAGTLNEVQTGLMYVLASTMIISLVCFSITVMMIMPQTRRDMD